MKKNKTMGTLFLKTKTVHWFVFPTTCHCCRMNTEVVSVLWELENISLIKEAQRTALKAFHFCWPAWAIVWWNHVAHSASPHGCEVCQVSPSNIPCGFSSQFFIKIKMFSSKYFTMRGVTRTIFASQMDAYDKSLSVFAVNVHAIND